MSDRVLVVRRVVNAPTKGLSGLRVVSVDAENELRAPLFPQERVFGALCRPKHRRHCV